MIVVQSQNLLKSASFEVNQFCQSVFQDTSFSNVIIQFETFDPTYSVKATTDAQPIGAVVTYNTNPQDSIDEILAVLAHESIHVHQLSEKRLQYSLMHRNGAVEWGFLWEGQPYFYPKTAKEVLSLPWEIEAYEQSQGVLDKYYDKFYKKSLQIA